MILASDLISSLGVAIPLVIVFGIFVIGPLTHRGRWSRHADDSQLDAIAETQRKILDELEAVRVRLDDVDRVLTTVE